MSNLSLEDKKIKIGEYEERMARQLARLVIDKPIPPVWMILIPVFFVFYAWKIKEYSSGLKNFAENYLSSRRRALETAYEAERSGKPPDIEQLVKDTKAIPAHARQLYQHWITLLIDHYRNLLKARGDTVQGLIRSHYRDKLNYMLFNNQLDQAENEFTMALLPKIEGEQQDVRYILDKMKRGITDLHRQEVEEAFS
jgi:hypothetical protein